jgi:hypothetical protein
VGQPEHFREIVPRLRFAEEVRQAPQSLAQAQAHSRYTPQAKRHQKPKT